jgi:hypothetical protein
MGLAIVCTTQLFLLRLGLQIRERLNVVTVRIDYSLDRALDHSRDLVHELDAVYNISSQFAVGNITIDKAEIKEFQGQLQRGLELSELVTDEVARVENLFLVPYVVCQDYLTTPTNYLICPIIKTTMQSASNTIKHDFYYSEVELLLHYTSILANAEVPDNSNNATGIWTIVPEELKVRLHRFKMEIGIAEGSRVTVTSVLDNFYTSMFQSLLTASLCSFMIVWWSAFKLLSSYKRLLKTLRNQKESEKAHFKGDVSDKTAMASKVADFIGLQVSNFLVTYVWNTVIIGLLLFIIRFNDSRSTVVEEASGVKYQLLLPALLKVIWKNIVVDYFLGRGSNHGGYIAYPVLYGWYEFANIFFMGVVGALIAAYRILYGIGVALLVLPRTDMSILPRGFEDYDPGYGAFQAVVQMDAEHNNPVAIVFMYLLLGSLEEKQHHLHSIPPKEKNMEIKRMIRKRRVRNRWLLLLTLVNNPILIGMRVHVRTTKKKISREAKLNQGKKHKGMRGSIYHWRKNSTTDLVEEAQEKRTYTKIITLNGVPREIAMQNSAVRGRQETGGSWSWFVTSNSFMERGLIPTPAFKRLFHEEVVGPSPYDLLPHTFVDDALREALFDGNVLQTQKSLYAIRSTATMKDHKSQLRHTMDTRSTMLCPRGIHFLKRKSTANRQDKPLLSIKEAILCGELINGLECHAEIEEAMVANDTSPSEAIKNVLCDHLNQLNFESRVYLTLNSKFQCSAFAVPRQNSATICLHCETMVMPYQEKTRLQKVFAPFPEGVRKSGVHIAFLEQFWALEREVMLFIENSLMFNPSMEFSICGYQNVSPPPSHLSPPLRQASPSPNACIFYSSSTFYYNPAFYSCWMYFSLQF